MDFISGVHFLLFIFNSIYAFIVPKGWFDVYYLWGMFATSLSWTLLKGECILSVLYKKYKNPNYRIGENRSVDDLTTLFGERYKIYMEYLNLPIMVLQSYNIYIVLKRNHISSVFAYLYFIYILGLRFTEHYLYQFMFFIVFALALIKITKQLWK
jgi:hypothetical protein